MAVLSADGALNVNVIFGLERTSPSSMAFLLAILTIVFIDSLYLLVVAIQKFLQFLILLPIQDLLNLIHTLFQLIVIIRHDNDMQRLEVLKDILLSLVGSSTPHGYLAARPLLDQFLRLSSRTNDLTDIVGLGVLDGVFREEDLLELLEGFVVLRRHESMEE
jgi:hypothetical protein